MGCKCPGGHGWVSGIWKAITPVPPDDGWGPKWMAPGWGGRCTWVVPSLVLQLPPTLLVNPYPQPVSNSSPHTPSFLLPVSPTKPQPHPCHIWVGSPWLPVCSHCPAHIRSQSPIHPKVWSPQDTALAPCVCQCKWTGTPQAE